MNNLKQDPTPHPYLDSIRYYSREMLRELGMLSSRFKRTGTSPSESHALIELERNGDMHVGKLAETLKLDISTTSRVVQSLANRELVRIKKDPEDQRRKFLSLTKKGISKTSELNDMANERVLDALKFLSEDQKSIIEQGFRIYVKALARARARANYAIRPVRRSDNSGLARVFFEVLPEFACTEPNTVITDEELNSMYEHYQHERSSYNVVECSGKVVGGCGMAHLAGAPDHVCELRKMYLLPEARGLGLGEELMELALNQAREVGYTYCYLETRERMHQAKAMYQKYGFELLSGPMGNTGHTACECWFGKEL